MICENHQNKRQSQKETDKEKKRWLPKCNRSFNKCIHTNWALMYLFMFMFSILGLFSITLDNKDYVIRRVIRSNND